MDALYYLAMLIGIIWLAAWSVAPPSWQARFWWPFDRIEPEGEARTPPGGISRRRPPLSRRHAEPAPAAEPPRPPPGRPRPWRDRRRPG